METGRVVTNRRVGSDIVDYVVEQHLGRVHAAYRQVVEDVGHRVGLHLHIGLDAAAVAHLAAGTGVEHMRQRVGNALAVETALAPFGIVDGLYAAS